MNDDSEQTFDDAGRFRDGGYQASDDSNVDRWRRVSYDLTYKGHPVAHHRSETWKRKAQLWDEVVAQRQQSRRGYGKIQGVQLLDAGRYAAWENSLPKYKKLRAGAPHDAVPRRFSPTHPQFFDPLEGAVGMHVRERRDLWMGHGRPEDDPFPWPPAKRSKASGVDRVFDVEAPTRWLDEFLRQHPWRLDGYEVDLRHLNHLNLQSFIDFGLNASDPSKWLLFANHEALTDVLTAVRAWRIRRLRRARLETFMQAMKLLRLRRCKFPGCDEFLFGLASPRGGRPPLYCSEHATARHRKQVSRLLPVGKQNEALAITFAANPVDKPMSQNLPDPHRDREKELYLSTIASDRQIERDRQDIIEFAENLQASLDWLAEVSLRWRLRAEAGFAAKDTVEALISDVQREF